MGKKNGPYNADFSEGVKVRIKSFSFLNEFRRSWKYHHPLQANQLQYAGQIATVASVSYAYGADELYTLVDLPGIWNEECLQPLDSSD
jgi:hypothetical protein